MPRQNHAPLSPPAPGVSCAVGTIDAAHLDSADLDPADPASSAEPGVVPSQHRGADGPQRRTISEPRVRGIALESASPWQADLERPAARAFIALLAAFRATGGTAPAEFVDRLLQEHQAVGTASLARLIDARQVFGFEWRTGLWVPNFQFDADQRVLKSGVQRVRAALPARWSGWAVAAWFAAPNARLQGRMPADRLESDLEAVTRAVPSHASLVTCARPLVRRAHELAARV